MRWQKADVFNPAAVVRGDSVYVLYRCEDNPVARLGERTSRIGLAASADGIHFQKYPLPVLYPDTDAFQQYDFPGGCEDPRVVETADGRYIMTYTSWNYRTARLSIAVSRDLTHWEKKGPAFARACGGKFLDHWSKSGSIVTELREGKQLAVKVNGKYLMYWGEGSIGMAWADDLIDWTPELDSAGNAVAVVSPRSHRFDSGLAECGPPALVTAGGIALLYNGKNATDEHSSRALPAGTYSVGQVLFDLNQPGRIISRSDSSFLYPTLPHEMAGQYSSGTTFSEGMVFFSGHWFIYYGTADSYVGVAVME